MWKQLTRVSIPVEAGKPHLCPVMTRTQPLQSINLLQLKKYLSGEAMKAVQSLGCSVEAYETAN